MLSRNLGRLLPSARAGIVRSPASAASSLSHNPAPRVQARRNVHSFSAALRVRSSGFQKPLGQSEKSAVSSLQFQHSLLPRTRRSFSSLPEHITLTMPALSPTMEIGNIATWAKKEGDSVASGEVLCDVETDKAVVAFESTEDGFLAKILVPDGTQDVTVGTPVAIMVEEEADLAAFKDYSPEAAPAAPAPAAADAPTPPATPEPAAAATPAQSAATPAAPSNSGERVVASPLARQTALDKGVPLDQVSGTGPGRRILNADVAEFVPRAAPAAAAAATSQPTLGTSGTDFEDIPHTSMRRVIADRLQQSKQEAPHYYLTSDIRMDVALKLRKTLNEIQEKNGQSKISVNDLVVKAAALACLKVPEVNSSWQEGSIRKFNYVDVSVAVSTPTGLITPIVKDADIKGLGSIASDVRDMAGRARDGKLQPAEYQGGTFTVSNLGMFGVKQFTAVINPPQSAILAVGSSEQRLVPIPGSFKDGQAAIDTATFMSVTLSCDHRVIDGATGAQWMQAFRGFLEDPNTMLL